MNDLLIDIKERFFSENKLNLSDEQVEAIACENSNTLLCARAGTGKTLTISAKVWHLIKNRGVSPNEIMVLAFNKEAAIEVRDRINLYLHGEDFLNARTFDSLAYQVARPDQKIIEDCYKEKIDFYNTLMDKDFGNDCFEKFIRWLSLDMLNQYVEKRYNNDLITLKGERVKSPAEKLIADYLFKMNVNYQYEQVYRIVDNGQDVTMRPDFTIILDDGKKIIWEHFGMNNREYNELAKHKRQLWQREASFGRIASFMVTDYSNLEMVDDEINKVDFFKFLNKKLKEEKIALDPLSGRQICEYIYKNKQTIIMSLLDTYINLVQAFDVNEHFRKSVADLAEDPAEKAFLEFADVFYQYYTEYLPESGLTSYHQIRIQAASAIRESRDMALSLDGYKNQEKCELKNLKWILIDEYQDFNASYYNLISAIRAINPQVKIFCVGDDWQAINGFAGSDLKYFKHFGLCFGDCKQLYLTYNRRCPHNIVDYSNTLMDGRGLIAKSLSVGGKIDEMNLLRDFMCLEGELITNKLVKACKTIYEHYKADKTMSIVFLSRTNLINDLDLQLFKKKIANALEADETGDFEARCEFSTVHQYKGKESDIVVLLNAENDRFPLLRKDMNRYFQVFRSYPDIIEEDRRLLYVGCTRAKNTLILISKSHESATSFIKELQGKYQTWK